MISLKNSGVTWGVVALSIVTGLQAVVHLVSPTIQIILIAIIASLTLFTHSDQIKAGKVGKA